MNPKLLSIKPTVTMADLEKIDVRVGRIEKVEDIEKSDKLVRLIVDFGEFKRTILVGLKKERANPKEMIGEVSEGMLYDIGYTNGIIPVLAIPEKDVPDGVSAG